MAAATFRAASSKGTGATSALTAWPAGTVNGDLGIMVAAMDGSAAPTCTGGATWTLLPGCPVTVTGGRRLYVWSGVVSNNATPGGDQTVACSNSTVILSQCLVYQSGTFDATTPTEIEQPGTEATNDTSFSFAPGTTTGGADRLVLCASTILRDSNTASVPVCTNASLTSLASRVNSCTNTGPGAGFGVTEGTKAAAGGVGTFACTYLAASPKTALSFAIRPAASFTTHSKSVSVDATAAIETAPQRVRLRSVSVDAAALIATAPQRVLQRQVALGATAGISVAGAFFTTFERALALDATAAIETSGTFYSILERALALAATADIATSGEREAGVTTHSRSVSVDATAAIATAPQRVLQRSASVDAAASIATASQRALQRSVALSATASAEVAAFRRDIERSVALAAAGSIETVPQRTLLRRVSVDATAPVVVAGQIQGQAMVHVAAVRLDATAAIEASALRIISRSIALGATADIVTAASFYSILARSVALAASADIAVTPQRVLLRSVALAAAAAIETVPQRELRRAITLAAIAEIETQGRGFTTQAPWYVGPIGLDAPSLESEIDLEPLGFDSAIDLSR